MVSFAVAMLCFIALLLVLLTKETRVWEFGKVKPLFLVPMHMCICPGQGPVVSSIRIARHEYDVLDIDWRIDHALREGGSMCGTCEAVDRCCAARERSCRRK